MIKGLVGIYTAVSVCIFLAGFLVTMREAKSDGKGYGGVTLGQVGTIILVAVALPVVALMALFEHYRKR